MALEHDLQFALSKGELDLEYQPIVDPRSGRAICCEALLRWRHPMLGDIPPDVFIPIAEATGLIVPIGTWVLTIGLRRGDALEFRHQGRGQLVARPVQARPRDRRHRHGRVGGDDLAPSRLDLEITEFCPDRRQRRSACILEELRSKEIGISLDDFGTGFASLSYLNDFPFSKIKIDRKFSQDSIIRRGHWRSSRPLSKSAASCTSSVSPKALKPSRNSSGCEASVSMRSGLSVQQTTASARTARADRTAHRAAATLAQRDRAARSRRGGKCILINAQTVAGREPPSA